MRHPLLRLAWVAGVAALMALPSVAFGYPIYSRLYRVKYGQQGGCNVCHEEGGGTKRNAYGEQWQRSGENMEAFGGIEPRDSDGDGASNLDEIKGGSNPGNRTSTPARPGHKWNLRHAVPVPVEQMRAALGSASDYGFRELELSEEQVKKLEAVAGRPLRFEERHPTLYFALAKTRRTGATALFVYPQLKQGPSALLIGLQASGKLNRIFLLRAGDDDLRIHRSFVDCLEKQEDLASPTGGKPACVPAPAQEATGKEIVRALQLGLATVAAAGGS